MATILRLLPACSRDVLAACAVAGSLAACTQNTGTFKHDDSDPGTDSDSGPFDTGTVDTSDTDGDLDDDGYTPEEGDCDDSSVYASPAREEDTNDGADNDCDGRVDEDWTGVDVAYYNSAGSSSIFSLDAIGRVTDEYTLDNSCGPVWLDHRDGPLSDGTDEWVINNNYAAVAVVARDGTCTDVGDFSDADVYPYGVFGVAAGLDGTIYAATLDNLVVVAEDGTLTSVASWKCNFEAVADHELAAYSLAVDPSTGVVGLFGYFGAFATYDPSSGVFTLLAAENWETSTLNTFSGAHKDGGGWYSPAVDGATGAYGIYKFNLEEASWVQQEEWSDEDWAPFMLAIDGDEGDYYVTANAGWFYTVWRVVAGDGYAAQLYSSDGTVQSRAFYGIVSNY
ncbi:MAG: hypothetical protein EXR69_04955 [Myxococcales bacterium]|nr:hypothetical protein [Myxococcales bacterium]